MTRERWTILMQDDDLSLTADEISEGWHWCYDWDGLLVGPGMAELGSCLCIDEDHPARNVRIENK